MFCCSENFLLEWPKKLCFTYFPTRFSLTFLLKVNNLGPVPWKMVKFNLGLLQILSKAFLPKNMQPELTKLCWALILRNGNGNTKCYSKQYIGR